MNIEKLTKEIGRMDSAFIDEALDYGAEKTKRGITMSKKKLISTAIAAALVVALATMSVSAAVSIANYADDKTSNEVIRAAEIYIAESADSDGEFDLATAVLMGLGYDGEVMIGEADFGFSGLKPIYNVSVKVGGYAYSLVLDAKTKEVLSCDRAADEGWAAHIEEVREERLETRDYKSDIVVDEIKKDDVVIGDITTTDAADIICDYLENDECSLVRNSFISVGPNYATNPLSRFVRVSHAGYVYEALVDSVSGEILHLEAFAIADGYNLWYSGSDPVNDVHIHEHTDDREFIGSVGAKRAAAEALSSDGRDWSVGPYERHENGSQTMVNEIAIADLGFPEDLDYYYLGTAYCDGDLKLVFVEARTGEVLAICDSNP